MMSLLHFNPIDRGAARPQFRAAVFCGASLLASSATLVAAMAAIQSSHWILFGLSGLLLMAAALAVWSAGSPRTIEPETLHLCRRVWRWNHWVLRGSILLWLAAAMVPAVYLALGR